MEVRYVGKPPAKFSELGIGDLFSFLVSDPDHKDVVYMKIAVVGNSSHHLNMDNGRAFMTSDDAMVVRRYGYLAVEE